MPTGYTSKLYGGEDQTFEDFALSCARAMGALIHMRDDSSKSEMRMDKVSDYLYKSIDEHSNTLKAFLALTPEQWNERQQEEILSLVASNNEYSDSKSALRDRYNTMLEKVKEWVPPTPDHNGLKDFMISQLEDSIKFDCSEFQIPIPDRIPWEDYSLAKMGSCIKRLTEDKKRLAEEIERVENRNKWILTLKQNLDGEH